MNEDEIRIPSRRPPPPEEEPSLKAPPANSAPLHKRRLGRPSPKDWYLFSLELRTMLEAGLPMTQALSLLEKHSERHRVKKAAAALGRSLEARKGIERAVHSSKELPSLMQAMLILGSRSGRVVEILDLVIRHYRWMLDIRSQIMRGLWYPAALVILGALVMVARDSALAVLLGRMDTPEAVLTYGIKYYGPIVIGGALGYACTVILKLKSVRPVLDRVILTVPLLGNVAKKYALAVFFEVLAACVEAGMPITMAYQLAAESTTNRHIGERLEDSIYLLQDGESLGETLRQSGVLDRGSLGVVRSGEAAAEAPFLMRKLAQHFNQEIQVTIKFLTTINIPLMFIMLVVAYFIDSNVLGWLAFALVFLMMLI